MGIIIALIVFFVFRGTNVVYMQKAQSGRVTTTAQTIAVTTIYCAIQCIAMLMFPPYNLFIPHWEFYIYPLGFAIMYSLGTIILLKALRLGSAAIANTIGQFNTLVPVVFGMLFWNEKLSLFQIAGIILFSAGLMIYSRSSVSVGETKQKVSAKFLIVSVLSMLIIGAAVIFTKLGMAAFPDCGKQYLFYYALFASIIGGVISAFTARGELISFICDKKMMLNNTIAAVSLCITNYFFVEYINMFPTAIFMPTCAVVGMFGVIAGTRVLLHEKISKGALVSSIVCIIAVVFLNI